MDGLHGEFPEQPIPVGGLIRQAGRLDDQVSPQDTGVQFAAKVGLEGDPLSTNGLGDELDLDAFLLGNHHHSITFEGVRDGQEVYEITLLPKEDAAVVWGKIAILVRKDDLMPLYEEFFDENGKPVRKMTLTEVKMLGGRLLPTRMTVVPYDKPGEFTEVVYVEINFDVELSDSFFSLRNLKQQGE